MTRTPPASHGGVKTDIFKQMWAAKTLLREKLLQHIPLDKARVFDAFGGSGAMYERLWHHAEYYVACDLEWKRDGRLVYVGDNRRVLRTIDLQQFNIFDLDSYGCPYEQATIVAARRVLRAGELCGLVLTDGSMRVLRYGTVPKPLAALIGLPQTKVPFAHKHIRAYTAKALHVIAKRMNAELIDQYEAYCSYGGSVFYTTAVFRGKQFRPTVI